MMNPAMDAAGRATVADAKIVALARESRGEALQLIYAAHKVRIYTFLLRLLADPAAADDLTQDVFTKACQALGSLTSEHRVLPWLYRIATNTAIDHIRRRKRFTWLRVGRLAGTREEPLMKDEHGAVPERDQLRRVLATLPVEQAAALLLHALEGYSYNEIVDLLSAAVDGEANQVDQAIVRNHLAGCESCERRSQAWASMAAEIRSLPRLTPSARVDLAIRDLVERPDARQTWRVRGTGVRAFIAVAAAAIVVAVGLMPGPELPVGYNTPGTTERTLVAGVQQIVLNPRNNTLYVLDPNGAAVDARDPGTNFIKTRIAVGGRPNALALNESANTILVVDAERKRSTEIA